MPEEGEVPREPHQPMYLEEQCQHGCLTETGWFSCCERKLLWRL